MIICLCSICSKETYIDAGGVRRAGRELSHTARRKHLQRDARSRTTAPKISEGSSGDTPSPVSLSCPVSGVLPAAVIAGVLALSVRITRSLPLLRDALGYELDQRRGGWTPAS